MQLIEKRKTVEAFKWTGELYDLPNWAVKAQQIGSIKVDIELKDDASWCFNLSIKEVGECSVSLNTVAIGDYLVYDGEIKVMTEQELFNKYENICDKTV